MKMNKLDLYKAFLNVESIFKYNLKNSLCYYDYSFNADEISLNKDIYINNLI